MSTLMIISVRSKTYVDTLNILTPYRLIFVGGSKP